MAEARKRSRRKKQVAGKPAPPEPVAESTPVAESGSPPKPPTASDEPSDARHPQASADDLVFPAEPVAEPKPTKLTLPASGLAEEILAQTADAVGVSPPESKTRVEQDSVSSAVATPTSRTANISFFAGPQRDEHKAVEATEHLATFFLSKEEYGVDVRLVQEIIRVSEITQVPRAPESIKGVINLRGRIIPVVDLKRKLGLGAVEPSRQARIVVVQIRDRLIGLLVDGASQVLRVPVSSIEPAPEEVVEIEAHYIRGVAKLETRLIILVDLNRILALETEPTEVSR
jgi:purine-binding chemotaxis protein CheW